MSTCPFCCSAIESTAPFTAVLNDVSTEESALSRTRLARGTPSMFAKAPPTSTVPFTKGTRAFTGPSGCARKAESRVLSALSLARWAAAVAPTLRKLPPIRTAPPSWTVVKLPPTKREPSGSGRMVSTVPLNAGSNQGSTDPSGLTRAIDSRLATFPVSFG